MRKFIRLPLWTVERIDEMNREPTLTAVVGPVTRRPKICVAAEASRKDVRRFTLTAQMQNGLVKESLSVHHVPFFLQALHVPLLTMSGDWTHWTTGTSG